MKEPTANPATLCTADTPDQRMSSTSMNSQAAGFLLIDQLDQAVHQPCLSTTDIPSAFSCITTADLHNNSLDLPTDRMISSLGASIHPSQSVEVADAGIAVAAALVQCLGHLFVHRCHCSQPPVTVNYTQLLHPVCKRLVPAISPNILVWLQRGGVGAEAALAWIAAVARSCRYGQPLAALKVIAELIKQDYSATDSSLRRAAFETAALLTDAADALHDAAETVIPPAGPLTFDFAAVIDSSDKAAQNLLDVLFEQSISDSLELQLPDQRLSATSKLTSGCYEHSRLGCTLGLAARVPRILAGPMAIRQKPGSQATARSCLRAQFAISSLLRILEYLTLEAFSGYDGDLIYISRQQQLQQLLRQLAASGVLASLRSILNMQAASVTTAEEANFRGPGTTAAQPSAAGSCPKQQQPLLNDWQSVNCKLVADAVIMTRQLLESSNLVDLHSKSTDYPSTSSMLASQLADAGILKALVQQLAACEESVISDPSLDTTDDWSLVARTQLVLMIRSLTDIGTETGSAANLDSSNSHMVYQTLVDHPCAVQPLVKIIQLAHEGKLHLGVTQGDEQLEGFTDDDDCSCRSSSVMHSTSSSTHYCVSIGFTVAGSALLVLMRLFSWAEPQQRGQFAALPGVVTGLVSCLAKSQQPQEGCCTLFWQKHPGDQPCKDLLAVDSVGMTEESNWASGLVIKVLLLLAADSPVAAATIAQTADAAQLLVAALTRCRFSGTKTSLALSATVSDSCVACQPACYAAEQQSRKALFELGAGEAAHTKCVDSMHTGNEHTCTQGLQFAGAGPQLSCSGILNHVSDNILDMSVLWTAAADIIRLAAPSQCVLNEWQRELAAVQQSWKTAAMSTNVVQQADHSSAAARCSQSTSNHDATAANMARDTEHLTAEVDVSRARKRGTLSDTIALQQNQQPLRQLSNSNSARRREKQPVASAVAAAEGEHFSASPDSGKLGIGAAVAASGSKGSGLTHRNHSAGDQTPKRRLRTLGLQPKKTLAAPTAVTPTVDGAAAQVHSHPAQTQHQQYCLAGVARPGQGATVSALQAAAEDARMQHQQQQDSHSPANKKHKRPGQEPAAAASQYFDHESSNIAGTQCSASKPLAPGEQDIPLSAGSDHLQQRTRTAQLPTSNTAKHALTAATNSRCGNSQPAGRHKHSDAALAPAGPTTEASSAGSQHAAAAAAAAAGGETAARQAVDTAVHEAGSALGPCATALVKQEIGTVLVTPQQLQYWQIADQLWDDDEFQDLVQDFLLPRLAIRDISTSTRSGRIRHATTKIPMPDRISKAYPLLAYKLQQLHKQVQREQANPAAAAEGLESSVSARKLMRILRCLKLWESRQVAEPNMLQMLQNFAKDSATSSSMHTQAAAAAAVQNVVEVVDLTQVEEDDTTLQQFLSDEVDFVLVREVGSTADATNRQQGCSSADDELCNGHESDRKKICVKHEESA